MRFEAGTDLMLRVAAIFLLLCCTAHSEERGPREAEHKAEASQRDDRKASELRHLLPPSFAAPAPIINVYTGKHAGEESHCAAGEDWKERGALALCRSWEWLDAERVIAAWTVILGIATFLLYLATRKLVLDARETGARQIKISEQVADIAEKQLLIAGLQADIQKKQHAIGRLQFLATHRPRLKIRHVSVADPGLRIGHPTMFYKTGEKIKGGLIVANVGGSAATIVETRYRIFFSKTGLPNTAPYDDDYRPNLLLPDYVMKAGESCATGIEDIIAMDPNHPDGSIELRPFERDGWTIYVMGQIRYKDDGDSERFMGFCQKRDKEGKFRPVNDPDYEYED